MVSAVWSGKTPPYPRGSQARRAAKFLRIGASCESRAKARLAEFLSDPAKFADGTDMPNLGLNAETIEDIASPGAKLSGANASTDVPRPSTAPRLELAVADERTGAAASFEAATG
jgi:hypothetical protein